jgi:hypothetical protein
MLIRIYSVNLTSAFLGNIFFLLALVVGDLLLGLVTFKGYICIVMTIKCQKNISICVKKNGLNRSVIFTLTTQANAGPDPQTGVTCSKR